MHYCFSELIISLIVFLCQFTNQYAKDLWKSYELYVTELCETKKSKL